MRDSTGTWALGYDFMVGLPKGATEARTPLHPKVGLMVTCKQDLSAPSYSPQRAPLLDCALCLERALQYACGHVVITHLYGRWG